MILPLADARWRYTTRYPGVLHGASNVESIVEYHISMAPQSIKINDLNQWYTSEELISNDTNYTKCINQLMIRFMQQAMSVKFCKYKCTVYLNDVECSII